MDKNIIAAPLPIRWLLAQWISFTRSRGAALSSYRELGYRSPLLDNTRAQAQALEETLSAHPGLSGEVKCFVAMRYWHPLAEETARAVKAYQPDRVVLLPLYPQFSTTTVRSSLQSWEKACASVGLSVATTQVCCYPFNDGFISASAALIAEQLDRAPQKVRLLFSAHGLPEKVIADGDPYQWQCEETAARIVKALGREGLDWGICYQSRVGPLTWIGPSTDEALEQAAKDGVGVLIYPHAFVSEHVETLVEIEIEYREKAHELGLPFFGRIPTVGITPAFIDGLAQEVVSSLGKTTCARVCPDKFRRCPCKANGDFCITA
jgi:ferrochelatase